ncbi:hypothetical protein PoB_000891500 [Plakobranchus ocellatus]|uniref:Uncharacterized protein n=1 Tax=Plakobranchus ocellatus TaxID=259542 RepID=A0AAV3YI34_9GAST|nr:hypothetical protein PoB_000891500 [Plakobranchus ocellatus]
MNTSETGTKQVKWSERRSVKTYISEHQYDSCMYYLWSSPIESEFINSPVFKAAELVFADDADKLLLLIMATNYLRESLGRYPNSHEFFNLLAEEGLTQELIVQAFLNTCSMEVEDEPAS